MRSTFYRLSALGLLAFAVSSCGGGGGGGSTTPATVSSPSGTTGSGPINTNNTKVVNFTGPGTKVTVSIVVPARATHEGPSAVAAAIKKLDGVKKNNPHIRTMANTSPSDVIRAAGVQAHAWGNQVEATTHRSALYVSGATVYVEFLVTDNSGDVLVDELGNCPNGAGTCANSFDAPVSENGATYNISLFLYDYCDFLLSAGGLTNQTIVEGTNNTFNITLDGVAEYLYTYLDPSYTTSLAYGSPTTTTPVQVDVQALDEDDNVIIGPGVLLDANSLAEITSIDLYPGNLSTPPGISPTTNPVVVPVTYPLGTDPTQPLVSQQYSWDGTGLETYVYWESYDVTSGSPLVDPYPSYFYYGEPYETYSGYTQIDISQPPPPPTPTLVWTEGSNTYNGGGGPQFSEGCTTCGSPEQSTIEFPSVPVSGTYTFGFSENAPASQTLTFSLDQDVYVDDSDCSALGITTAPSSIAYAGSVSLSLTAGAPGTCEIQAYDGTNYAYLEIYVDQSTLTIQQHARQPASTQRTGGSK